LTAVAKTSSCQTEHARATPIGLAALRELAPGTGRVQSVVVRTQETLLRLGYPNGLNVVVALPEVPRGGAESDQDLDQIHPLAVRMRHGRAAFDCSVLGTSTTGPRRIRISVTQALALCASGVHTVLSTE
jgi:hypothetical protein